MLRLAIGNESDNDSDNEILKLPKRKNPANVDRDDDGKKKKMCIHCKIPSVDCDCFTEEDFSENDSDSDDDKYGNNIWGRGCEMLDRVCVDLRRYDGDAKKAKSNYIKDLEAVDERTSEVAKILQDKRKNNITANDFTRKVLTEIALKNQSYSLIRALLVMENGSDHESVKLLDNLRKEANKLKKDGLIVKKEDKTTIDDTDLLKTDKWNNLHKNHQLLMDWICQTIYEHEDLTRICITREMAEDYYGEEMPEDKTKWTNSISYVEAFRELLNNDLYQKYFEYQQAQPIDLTTGKIVDEKVRANMAEAKLASNDFNHLAYFNTMCAKLTAYNLLQAVKKGTSNIEPTFYRDGEKKWWQGWGGSIVPMTEKYLDVIYRIFVCNDIPHYIQNPTTDNKDTLKSYAKTLKRIKNCDKYKKKIQATLGICETK